MKNEIELGIAFKNQNWKGDSGKLGFLPNTPKSKFANSLPSVIVEVIIKTILTISFFIVTPPSPQTSLPILLIRLIEVRKFLSR